MRYEKRLIILAGDREAKATVKCERNGYGLTLDISCYHLSAAGGRYVLAVKEDDRVEQFDLGASPTSVRGLSLSEAFDLGRAHFIVYITRAGRAEPLLYGTLNRERLWKGNWLDGIETERQGDEGKQIMSAECGGAFAYSPRAGKFEDFLPKKIDAYEDDAIAEVNYYAGTPLSVFDRHDETENLIGSAQALPLRADAERTVFDVQRQYLENSLMFRREAQAQERPAASPSELQMGYIGGFLSASSGKKAGVQSYGLSDRSEPIESDAAPDGTPQRPVFQRRKGILYGETVLELKELAPSEVRTASDGAIVPPSADGGAGRKISGRKLNFYEQIEGQLNALFDKYPRDTHLESLLPFTKWVKVDYENDGRYYVVGIVGEKPDYICYGIPGVFTPAPPSALDGYCQWLPRDAAKPEGEGYWLLYQDAASGESVNEQ